MLPSVGRRIGGEELGEQRVRVRRSAGVSEASSSRSSSAALRSATEPPCRPPMDQVEALLRGCPLSDKVRAVTRAKRGDERVLIPVRGRHYTDDGPPLTAVSLRLGGSDRPLARTCSRRAPDGLTNGTDAEKPSLRRNVRRHAPPARRLGLVTASREIQSRARLEPPRRLLCQVPPWRKGGARPPIAVKDAAARLAALGPDGPSLDCAAPAHGQAARRDVAPVEKHRNS
jgi:hypothetical protein